MMQKTLKEWLKPWRMGTQLRVLSESYPMNSNMVGFRFRLCPKNNNPWLFMVSQFCPRKPLQKWLCIASRLLTPRKNTLLCSYSAAQLCLRNPHFLALNPFNAEATFIQCKRTQRFLKTIQTLSCWYSLEISRRVLSDEYPFARVSVIFQDFRIILYWPK